MPGVDAYPNAQSPHYSTCMKKCLAKMLQSSTRFDKVEGKALSTLSELACLFLSKCARASKEHGMLSGRSLPNALDVFYGCQSEMKINWNDLKIWCEELNRDSALTAQYKAYDHSNAKQISQKPQVNGSLSNNEYDKSLSNIPHIMNGDYPMDIESPEPLNYYQHRIQKLLENDEDSDELLVPSIDYEIHTQSANEAPESEIADHTPNGTSSHGDDSDKCLTPATESTAFDGSAAKERREEAFILPKNHPANADASLLLFYQPTGDFESTGMSIDDLPDQTKDIFPSSMNGVKSSTSRKRSENGEIISGEFLPAVDIITENERQWVSTRKSQEDDIIEQFAQFTIDNDPTDTSNERRQSIPWASTWMTGDMRETLCTLTAEDVTPLDSLFLGPTPRGSRGILSKLASTLVKDNYIPLSGKGYHPGPPGLYLGGVTPDGLQQLSERISDLNYAASKDTSLTLDLSYRHKFNIPHLKTMLTSSTE
ncbi:hypothetical protein H4219_000481 [Mycoemilia scoparia]|uniref:Bromodomain associated domain-containing protein n=1 Tax=Mycoemilia scoparia TaxID=417184 RepID=A0A9W8DXB6_9FUNG|nr:hypothetical protein H4219_000481 [Mycoemilia scoparia]